MVVSGKPFDDESGAVFNSGLIKHGKTFDYKFDTKGIFHYFCAVHPWQVGVIVVK
jgi:plastocyanin